MKLKLSYNKSVHENAAHYYELAKESKEKIAGLEKAMDETRQEIKKAQEEGAKKKDVRVKRQKEWYEKFHFAFTSTGKLMIGGRNAQQNDMIVSKHMDDQDLFFHADIQGGAVVVLKGGNVETSEQELHEAAQFAACFSKAWNNANAAVDVYAVTKNQLTKKVSGGFVPAGAFAIIGERKWFRNARLVVRIGLDSNNKMLVVPQISETKLSNELAVIPSKAGKDKGALAKSLAKRFSVHPDDLLELLPNGKSKTVQK